MQPITFTQDNAIGLHYPLCDALMVMVVGSQSGFKRMQMDNESLANIIFGALFDKMEVDHELTPVNSLVRLQR